MTDTIYDFGFDKTLNIPTPDTSTNVTPGIIEEGSNSAILNANFPVNSGDSAFTQDGKVTTVSPKGALQIQPIGDAKEVFILASDGQNGGTSTQGGSIDILAGFGRTNQVPFTESVNGGDILIEAGGASGTATIGGSLQMFAGQGPQAFGGGSKGNGDGGLLKIAGGTGGDTGNGGEAWLFGGNVTSGNGGNILIFGGDSILTGISNINGGNVFIFGGGLNAGNIGSSGVVILGNPGKVYIQRDNGPGGTTTGQHAILDAGLIATIDKTFQFPNKSGMLALIGTFSVQLPAVAATTSVFSTIVTVAGIRIEDALTISRSDQGVTAGYATTTTAKIFYSATPGNGTIQLNFFNLGAATGYTQHTFSYTAASGAQ